MHQKKILKNTVEIQEEERRRIAQDLHDELGAVLSICKMRLTSLEKNYTGNVSELLDLKAYLDAALKSTRRISRELMPVQLEQLGLKKSLLSFAHFAGESSEIEINTEIEISSVELPPSLQLGIYRIYAELVNNSMKYANASSVTARIDVSNESIVLMHEDDGQGIDFEQFESGLGMMSINNRIEYLGGNWKYGNKPEGGFYAEIIVPF
ncbi:MAG: sensor histidine kinase [Crocinitomicaceae bacterium]